MEFPRRLLGRYMDWQKLSADVRVNKYPLMENPLPTIAIVLFYFLTVYWGPRIMQNQKPFTLRAYTTAYNFFQVFFCAYYVISVYILTEWEPDGVYLMCKRWNPNVNPTTEVIAYFQYLNYVVRLIELTETLVIILRKKNRQLSYLHVLHHSFNVALAWITTRFQPGGSASTLCLVNFGVHFIMYSYYLASTHGSPLIQKITRSFKKYLTIIQMAQFIFLLILAVQDFGAVPVCRKRTFITYATTSVLIADLLLFINFYRVNYNRNTGHNKMS